MQVRILFNISKLDILTITSFIIWSLMSNFQFIVHISHINALLDELQQRHF